jgi:UDPglucose--hexose-1-phosphate uridylyltransferase
MLPAIVAETVCDHWPGWRARVVANKFPAVGQNMTRGDYGPFYKAAPGGGHHEIIVESPRHDKDLTAMSHDELVDVLATCQSRYRSLMADPAVRSVIVFRNRGTAAGASLLHPHSQIVALEAVPALVEARERTMLAYYEKEGRCLLCDIIARERAEGGRVVAENEAFLSVVPFAPAAPCEIWLLPKRHQADFSKIERDEMGLFAAALKDALARIGAALGDPPYNYVIDAATKSGLNSRGLHWRLRIVPRSTVAGGFELGTGVPITPSLPEDDAAFLRSARTVRASRPG